MKISIFNLKGGNLKTTCALNLALTMKIPIITNDIYSSLDKVLGTDLLRKILPDENFPAYDSAIYDLGSHLDGMIAGVLQRSHFVLVPMVNTSFDKDVGFKSLQTVLNYNKNVIVLSTRAKKGDYEEIRNIIPENIPVFEISESKVLKDLFDNKESVADRANRERGIVKKNIQKIADQFQTIISYMEKNINEE